MPPVTVRPPSTVSTRPVTQEESSEARNREAEVADGYPNATAEAMSDGTPRRRRG